MIVILAYSKVDKLFIFVCWVVSLLKTLAPSAKRHLTGEQTPVIVNKNNESTGVFRIVKFSLILLVLLSLFGPFGWRISAQADLLCLKTIQKVDKRGRVKLGGNLKRVADSKCPKGFTIILDTAEFAVFGSCPPGEYSIGVDESGEVICRDPRPYILGRSASFSPGAFSYSGLTGMRAANRMCRDTFTSEPTAHLCTFEEVQLALADMRFNPSEPGNAWDELTTWTIATLEASAAGFSGVRSNTCRNLITSVS
jgi:hypothetical protein